MPCHAYPPTEPWVTNIPDDRYKLEKKLRGYRTDVMICRRRERWYLYPQITCGLNWFKAFCSTAVPSACSPITPRNFCKMCIPLHPLHQHSGENKESNTSCPLPFYFILHQVANAPLFSSELPEAMLELLVELGEDS